MAFITPSIVGRKSLVVVVDDQRTGRTILETLIRGIDPDIEVAAFGDPESAIELIRSSPPDLVITDYMMPGMNGVGFIRKLRAMPLCADTPIMVVTVVDDKRIRYQALDAGATDFLNRPIDQHECRVRCRNLLTLRRQHRIISSRASWLEEQVALATKQIFDREQETLLRLAKAGEYRDEQTGNHVYRIAQYSRVIAKGLGLNNAECDAIESASPMHDIGKIGIPDHILLKPGKLTSAEFDIMRQHSRIGYEILSDSPSQYLQLGATIALSHHEKYDGSGYPERRSKDEIPIEARIVAVADVFDALTTARPYKKEWSSEDAQAYIENLSGCHFDPDCVEVFKDTIDEIEAVRHKLRDHGNTDYGHGVLTHAGKTS